MKFSEIIFDWYNQHKRDLPWRKTNDAYTIWLSEIIFQQTRIEQGLEYFNRFIHQYPTVTHLAVANETQVLKLWQGLGYYSRARNLLKTAQIIVDEHHGEFPQTARELLKLPGIGSYTAAAILSMAYNQAYPVVDGNVLRVISRIFGIDKPIDKSSGKKVVEAIAFELIDRDRPGDFNQALMEFGALHCKPINPSCRTCIFKTDCVALEQDRVKELPFKAGKVTQKKRYLEYLIFTMEKPDGKYIYMNHRKENDIWKGLYDFPHFDYDRKISSKQLAENVKSKFRLKKHLMVCIDNNIKHVLSHQIIFASFHLIKLNNLESDTDQELHKAAYEKTPIDKIKSLPIPRLIEIFLEKHCSDI